MPVILDKTAETIWIDLSTSALDALSLLKPCQDEVLSAYTIGPLVNDKKSNRNSPDVIRAYDYNSGNLLF
jgi:putative SOS response-associated peptidase YedK